MIIGRSPLLQLWSWVILLLLFYLFSANSFKATDPNDPNFNPYKFKFTDYTLKELPSVFDKLFPLGTERKFIENVLVSSACAHIYSVHRSGGDFQKSIKSFLLSHPRIFWPWRVPQARIPSSKLQWCSAAHAPSISEAA